MRIANSRGRALFLHDWEWFDVHEVSHGYFPSGTRELVSQLSAVSEWSQSIDFGEFAPAEHVRFDAPIPDPRQIFAVGLNYGSHAKELGMAAPAFPTVFTKFPSSLTGATDEILLPTRTVDWEAELVVVIGREARDVGSDVAHEFIAGFMNGQDLSERTMQDVGGKPQLCLAKSFPGFSPTGPYLTTGDELKDLNDLRITSTLIMEDGRSETVQDARTSDLVFSVPRLVSELSKIVSLYPGDLIFTGTPAGVGMGRVPPRYLHGGWRLRTEIEGLGAMENPLVSVTR